MDSVKFVVAFNGVDFNQSSKLAIVGTTNIDLINQIKLAWKLEHGSKAKDTKVHSLPICESEIYDFMVKYGQHYKLNLRMYETDIHKGGIVLNTECIDKYIRN